MNPPLSFFPVASVHFRKHHTDPAGLVEAVLNTWAKKPDLGWDKDEIKI